MLVIMVLKKYSSSLFLSKSDKFKVTVFSVFTTTCPDIYRG